MVMLLLMMTMMMMKVTVKTKLVMMMMMVVVVVVVVVMVVVAVVVVVIVGCGGCESEGDGEPKPLLRQHEPVSLPTETSRYCKSVNKNSDVGSVPVKLFSPRLSVFSVAARAPIVLGIVPVNMLPRRSRAL
jgi:hypothetical protein